jgi:type I restriction enzyme S subunit
MSTELLNSNGVLSENSNRISNWRKCKLSEVADIIMGQSPKSEYTTDDSSYIPLIGGAADMGELYPKIRRYTKKATKLSTDKDVILSIRATLGRPIFSDGEYCLGRGVAAIRGKKIDKKYLKYYFDNIERYLYEISSGTTFAQVSSKHLRNIELLVPPLPEQHRIVNQIESLFEKIDKAEVLINEAREGFEKRKEAILAKAFRGELTENWREVNSNILECISSNSLSDLKMKKFYKECNKAEENGYKKPKKPKEYNFREYSNNALPKSWRMIDLAEVVYDFKYGTSSKSDYTYSGTPVLRIPNIGREFCDISDLKYAEEEADINTRVEIDDILVIRSNGSKDLVGKANLVTNEIQDYAFASYLIRIRYVGICPRYLLFLLNSSLVRNQFFTKSKSTVGINNINTQQLASIRIPLPSYEEQTAIVERLELLLDKELIAEEITTYETVFNSMRKAILAKAFRGELATNDLNEAAINLFDEEVKEGHKIKEKLGVIKHVESSAVSLSNEAEIWAYLEDKKLVAVNDIFKLSKLNSGELYIILKRLQDKGYIKEEANRKGLLKVVKNENN